MAAYTPQPKRRSRLRSWLGCLWYGGLRRLLWVRMAPSFARERGRERLPCLQISHATPLLRNLKDVDMALQRSKVTNLKLAAERLDGILIRPGETFSYWRCVGNPCRRRGFVEGMVLRGGKVCSGVGGGLCQMSNLIYWMALHTPLTVVERHHHGYDVFPDANRTQPFGSGATCAYPHADLMLRNDTDETFQLAVRVGERDLEGSILGETPPAFRYEIVERDGEMRSEYWGGCTRHNRIVRRVFALDGQLLWEENAAENHAVMMYSPFLEEP